MKHKINYSELLHIGITVVILTLVIAGSAMAASGPFDVIPHNQIMDETNPGVTIAPNSGLSTHEDGTMDQPLSVVLNTPPTDVVTIAFSSSDESEVQVSPDFLEFTVENWDQPQILNLLGQDDDMDDGDQTISITITVTSNDLDYNGLSIYPLSVINLDDDTAGLVVNPTSGLQTTEAGGTATFTVRLNSQPTADVTVPVASQDTTEGTVSPLSLTFTPANWATNQTVTITGVNDDIVDGNVAYTVRVGPPSSADSAYNVGTMTEDVSVTNTDDDTAGIVVEPTTGLETSEAGGTDSFVIRLESQPTASVTINLSSSNAYEGYPDPTQVVLTAANWQAGVTVTVHGVNDDVDDDDQPYTINTSNTSSADPNYNDLPVPDVSVTNLDDDIAGVTVTPATGLVTSEGTPPTQATFTVYLRSKPLSNVTISVTSTDGTEGTVSPLTLTFTPENWNLEQTVTVTGVDDFVDDGDISYSIHLGPAVSSDLKYSGMVIPSVGVTNLDNDEAGILVDPTSGLVTSENLVTATFTVVLTSQPTANVNVPVVSQDTTEGIVSPSTLTFTPADWNNPRTVTITGVDDIIQDGAVEYIVTVGPAVSTDSGYNDKFEVNVSVTNQDNDTAGLTVQPSGGLETSETGQTATFTVRLNTQPLPAHQVTVTLSSSDETEGIVKIPAGRQLVFNPENWNSPQTVTIEGVDDLVADGNQAYEIRVTTSSTQPAYHNLTIPPVTVINLDNDFSPVGVNDTYYINLNQLVVQAPGVLANDSDQNPEDVLTAVITSNPPTGSLTFNANGSFTYQAGVGVKDGDTINFKYKVYDGISYSEDTTVILIVDLTSPDKATWVSPVEDGETYRASFGTIPLRARPLTTQVSDPKEFDRIWYAIYDDSLPGTIDDKLINIGSASVAPYTVNLSVSSLKMGWNFIYAFVYDKAGNRSDPPNNYIYIFREPHYTTFLYLPVVFK